MDNFEVAFLLLLCMMFPLFMNLILSNIVKGQETANKTQIQALNKDYYDYQRQCTGTEIKTLSNCIIEVEYLDNWDYIEYRKKFKNKPTEVVLEL